MSQLSRKLPFESALDRRWFAAFVLLQGAVLWGILFAPPKVMLFALAGVVGSVFIAFLPVYPWIVVPLIVASTSLDMTGQLIKNTALGIPLSGFHLAFGMMVLGGVLNTFLKQRTYFPQFELKGPLLLLLGCIGVSLLYSPNQPEATIGFFRTFFLIVFLYLSQVLLDSKKALAVLVGSVGVAIVGGAALGIVQIVTEKFYLPASFVIAVGANAPRATGTFQNPNTFGTFLMSGSVLLFAVWVSYRKSMWHNLFLLVSIGVGLGGLIVTFSRSNWLATIVGLGVVLYMIRKIHYVFYAAIVFVLTILAVKEFVPFAEHIFERFVSIFTLAEQFGSAGRASSSGRVYFALAGFEMFLEHPLLGAGWRAFPVLFDSYKDINFPHWLPTKESHTLFANILAELGLVGFGASCWIVWRTLKRGFDGLRVAQDPFLTGMLRGLIAVFIAFQVSLSFTADFSNNFLWMYTGLIFAVVHLVERQHAA